MKIIMQKEWLRKKNIIVYDHKSEALPLISAQKPRELAYNVQTSATINGENVAHNSLEDKCFESAKGMLYQIIWDDAKDENLVVFEQDRKGIRYWWDCHHCPDKKDSTHKLTIHYKFKVEYYSIDDKLVK